MASSEGANGRSRSGGRTGILLAGGRGSRVGGAVKPLLRHRGRTLLAHALDALAPHCVELLVMAGAHAAEISRVAEGARVFADPGEGPHVALRLAARAARHPTLVVAPADSPFLAPAIAALVAAGPGAVAREGDGVNPLVGVFGREELLAATSPPLRSLQEAVARLLPPAIPVSVPPGSLLDVDAPADLARLADDE